MDFFINFIVGIFIGFGAILPGVSSGVFCVIFGIYEKLINSVLNIFTNFKKNFFFLLPIAIGSFIGIIVFGNIIKYFFYTFKAQSSFIFIGLILGTIPCLFRQVSSNSFNYSNSHNSCKSCKLYVFSLKNLKNFIPFILSFSLGIFMIFLERNLNFKVDNIISFFNIFYFVFLFISGFIMSIGIVVPGISNTVILMCLGIYSQYLTAISSLDITFLLPLGIGVILGSIIWLKLIKYLLNNFYKPTFYSIIGFTLGSVFVLYPRH